MLVKETLKSKVRQLKSLDSAQRIFKDYMLSNEKETHLKSIFESVKKVLKSHLGQISIFFQ